MLDPAGGAPLQQQRQLAAVAQSACFLYERQLQHERQPELAIQLPAGPGGSSGKQAEVSLRIEYRGGSGGSSDGDGDGGGGDGGGGDDCKGPSAGLHFWERYAATDSQVRRTSAWLPCVDSPSAAVAWEGLDLTCRADEVAVGPGRLECQSWADGERSWRTFHYALPLACPPCQLGFAVGPFRAAASALPAAAAAANGKAADPPRQLQLTHFAPQQAPAELAVAAVLCAPPSLSAPNGKAPGGGAGAGSDGLSRSAHFFGLVWSFFEELLGAKCPLGAMQQVGRLAGGCLLLACCKQDAAQAACQSSKLTQACVASCFYQCAPQSFCPCFPAGLPAP